MFLFQELISLLQQSHNEEDKLRIVKAMGNMGAKEIIMPIKSIIEDRSQSKILRAEAVASLRKTAKPFNKMVCCTSFDILENIATTRLHVLKLTDNIDNSNVKFE